jgi:hypothetical protein
VYSCGVQLLWCAAGVQLVLRASTARN